MMTHLLQGQPSSVELGSKPKNFNKFLQRTRGPIITNVKCIPLTFAEGWTEEEKQIFEDGFSKHGRNWEAIVRLFGGKKSVFDIKCYASVENVDLHRTVFKSGKGCVFCFFFC